MINKALFIFAVTAGLVLGASSAHALGTVTLIFNATPTTVSSGGAVNLSWSSNGDSCGGTGTGGSSEISGSWTVNPTVTTTYTITCYNTEPPTTQKTQSRTVTVTAGSPDLTAGSVSPTTATVGTAVTLSSTISNGGAASTGAGFTNLFQRATDASGTGATDIGTHSAATLAAGANSAATLSYTFLSAATWYVRACGDKNSAASTGTITESNESNNCSAWTAVSVSSSCVANDGYSVDLPNASPYPANQSKIEDVNCCSGYAWTGGQYYNDHLCTTVGAGFTIATISASPTSITPGQSSTITWSSTNATSCTKNFGSGTATSGSTAVSPTANTTYTVSCTGSGGTSPTASATVTVSAAQAPVASITASPTSLTSGQSSTVTWSATNATSCTGTGFSTGNQTSGSVSVSPTVTTTYSISCTGTGGTGTNTVAVTVASAPTTTTYTGELCSGGTYLGSYGDYTNSCVAYCTGLSASCCSTYHSYGDSGESYACAAYSNTTATVAAPLTGGCSGGGGYNEGFVQDGGGGGEELCDWTAKSATLITYGPAVSAALVTNPTSISAGQTALVTWSSTNATSCTGTGFTTSNATSGSVSVSPSVTTTYTLTCTNGVGGTATDSKTLTVNVFTVTCSASPNPVTVNQLVSWTSAATGGTGSYTYSWSGTDSLTGAGSSVQKTYTALGEKVATLSVTSGGNTIATACTGTPCQQASCTCTGAGCGVIVQEGVSTDISAGTPVISTGSLFPGGTVTFGASILNLGNNSISSVFQNRFQVDIGADGTYNLNLDTAGTAGTAMSLTYGQSCTGGTIVATDNAQLYGSGDLSDTIQAMCEESSVSGQCCSTVVTTGSGGGSGGGGGGGGTNLVERAERNVAALYKSLALADGPSYYDIALTVRSGAWTASSCTFGSCYLGTWQAQSGSQYEVPFGQTAGAVSPPWTNIPAGTHRVRMCTDSPTSQLSETNEGNNCGADYEFSVSGFNLTSGTPGLNSGTLISGQQITFFGAILNSPTSYVASGQCQTTVVVTSGNACSIAVSRDSIQWSTTGATIVSEIEPLTSSPTVPATGGGGMIVTSPTELGFFTSQPLKADMLANGGVSFPETSFVNRTGFSSQVTLDRACKMITGKSDATAKAWGARGWSSCGNNGNLTFNGSVWVNASGCTGAHLFSQLDCQYQGSPYPLSGTHTFSTPLSPGTHTYELTNNATPPNNTCQATIVVPENTVGLCTLTATPSIISSGNSSILTWTTNNASTFAITGIGTVTPTGAGSVPVTPPTTTTYTGTATTDTSVFEFTGCAPSQFQIDTGNNGSWDTTLNTTQCLTSLGINQSTQVTSPVWTAIVGTHAIRLCANTPLAEDEAETGDNCGEELVFTITPPTQCADEVDNNGNGLIDLADPACTSGADTTEETHSASTLSLSANRTTIQKGTTVTLTWSAAEVVADSCAITASPGSSSALTGASGTFVSQPLQGETTFSLSCTSMQTGAPVEVRASVKLAPVFEEV